MIWRVWETLVQVLETSSLGPIIEQVAAELLKMLPVCKERVLMIFKYLLMDQGRVKELQPYLERLNFIPDHPDTAEINVAIRKYNGITGATQFRQVLKGVIVSLENQSSEVRAQTLKKLDQVLRNNQGKLQGLIMASDQVDRNVTETIKLLLKCTRDQTDRLVTSMAARCLGKIGAVDPGRLTGPSGSCQEEDDGNNPRSGH